MVTPSPNPWDLTLYGKQDFRCRVLKLKVKWSSEPLATDAFQLAGFEVTAHGRIRGDH
jgi:hypothetical protein